MRSQNVKCFPVRAIARPDPIAISKHGGSSGILQRMQFSNFLKNLSFKHLGWIGTLAILSLLDPGAARAKPSSERPYVILVDGYRDCCAWRMAKVQQQLYDMGAEIRIVSWESFTHRRKQKNFISNDRQFVREAEDFINNRLDPDRPLFLIGHGFGGGALLNLAPKIEREILFLGTIDPVAVGGLRILVRSREVPANVNYFFNRWQRNRLEANNIFPLDNFLSGKLDNCRATTCDQKEQGLARKADSSPIGVPCGPWEITCPGYEPWPGGSNGRKQKRLYHEDMPTDARIQRQIVDAIEELVQ